MSPATFREKAWRRVDQVPEDTATAAVSIAGDDEAAHTARRCELWTRRAENQAGWRHEMPSRWSAPISNGCGESRVAGSRQLRHPADSSTVSPDEQQPAVDDLARSR